MTSSIVARERITAVVGHVVVEEVQLRAQLLAAAGRGVPGAVADDDALGDVAVVLRHLEVEDLDGALAGGQLPHPGPGVQLVAGGLPAGRGVLPLQAVLPQRVAAAALDAPVGPLIAAHPDPAVEGFSEHPHADRESAADRVGVGAPASDMAVGAQVTVEQRLADRPLLAEQPARDLLEGGAVAAVLEQPVAGLGIDDVEGHRGTQLALGPAGASRGKALTQLVCLVPAAGQHDVGTAAAQGQAAVAEPATEQPVRGDLIQPEGQRQVNRLERCGVGRGRPARLLAERLADRREAGGVVVPAIVADLVVPGPLAGAQPEAVVGRDLQAAVALADHGDGVGGPGLGADDRAPPTGVGQHEVVDLDSLDRHLAALGGDQRAGREALGAGPEHVGAGQATHVVVGDVRAEVVGVGEVRRVGLDGPVPVVRGKPQLEANGGQADRGAAGPAEDVGERDHQATSSASWSAGWTMVLPLRSSSIALRTRRQTWSRPPRLWRHQCSGICGWSRRVSSA